MSLPSSILSRFDEEYEGLKMARFTSASEAHNMETNLKWLNKSYKTKIVKHKRRGREFLVMIVEPFTQGE